MDVKDTTLEKKKRLESSRHARFTSWLSCFILLWSRRTTQKDPPFTIAGHTRVLLIISRIGRVDNRKKEAVEAKDFLSCKCPPYPCSTFSFLYFFFVSDQWFFSCGIIKLWEEGVILEIGSAKSGSQWLSALSVKPNTLLLDRCVNFSGILYAPGWKV